MKTFSVVVNDNESALERLVGLPGWSHWSQPFKQQVFYYPFEESCRTAYFKAKHRREACKQLDRAGVWCMRPVSDN